MKVNARYAALALFWTIRRNVFCAKMPFLTAIVAYLVNIVNNAIRATTQVMIIKAASIARHLLTIV